MTYFASDDNQQEPSPEQKQIVKYGEHPDDIKARAQKTPDPIWSAVIWCGLGAVAATSLSFVGTAMVAYGFATAQGPGSSMKTRLAALAALLVGLGFSIWNHSLGWLNIADTAISLVVALVLATLVVKKKATVTSDYIVAALAGLGIMGLMAINASQQGTTLVTAMTASMSEAIEQVAGQYDLAVAAQLRQWQWLLMILWPFAYVVIGGGLTLCAHAGARIATARPGQPPTWTLMAFDAPTWPVVALIVSVALFAFSSVFGAYAMVAQSVAVTVVLAIRFIFMVQGFAVLTFWLARSRMGCLLRTLIIFLAVQVEVSFCILSILGLVDFWANFRHLERGSATHSTPGV